MRSMIPHSTNAQCSETALCHCGSVLTALRLPIPVRLYNNICVQCMHGCHYEYLDLRISPALAVTEWLKRKQQVNWNFREALPL